MCGSIPEARDHGSASADEGLDLGPGFGWMSATGCPFPTLQPHII